MRVKVIRSFCDLGIPGVRQGCLGSEGDIIDIPESGTDWIAAGFVVPLEEPQEVRRAQPVKSKPSSRKPRTKRG